LSTSRGPKALDSLAAFAPLALVMVRERPLLVAAVVGAVYAVDIALFGSPASITQFVTMTVTVFWAAILAPPRKWLVLAGAAGLLMLTQLLDPEELDPGSRVFPFVFQAMTWTVGTMMHNRQRLAMSLADRAERLEAEQELVARAAVLDERVRIARELHDVVAHSASVMVVQAVAGRKTLAAGRDGADGAFGAIEATGQQALTEMRRVLGVLRHYITTRTLFLERLASSGPSRERHASTAWGVISSRRIAPNAGSRWRLMVER
jgi:signal transduction histidine kinase